MSRSAKKSVYGVFYLVLLFLIAWGVFRAFVPAPNCRDGVLNQKETDVDCGGPCVPCAVAQPDPLRVERVWVFSTESGKVVLLAKVANPNAAYAAASFSYAFAVRDNDGVMLETTSWETESLHDTEVGYLFTAATGVSAARAMTAELILENITWKPTSEVPRPRLSTSQITTEVEGNEVVVRGMVGNESPFAARKVKVVARLFDRLGDPLFAAQTVVDEVPGGGMQAFAPIKFPSDAFLTRSVEPSLTEVFVSGL